MKKYRSRPSMLAYWAGIFTAWATQSLVQDIRGKADCLRSMEVNWIDAKYTVPIAIGMLTIAVLMLGRAMRREDRE